jgi:hypothetical protein
VKIASEPAIVHHGLIESEEGPEAGHRYRLTITAASGFKDEESSRSTEPDRWGQLRTVEVRAHSLRAALLKAAELPLQTWFQADGDAPVLPLDQLR